MSGLSRGFQSTAELEKVVSVAAVVLARSRCRKLEDAQLFRALLLLVISTFGHQQTMV